MSMTASTQMLEVGRLINCLTEGFPSQCDVDYFAILGIDENGAAFRLSDVLRGRKLVSAIELLVENGWARGDFFEEDGVRYYWRLGLTPTGYSSLVDNHDCVDHVGLATILSSTARTLRAMR